MRPKPSDSGVPVSSWWKWADGEVFQVTGMRNNGRARFITSRRLGREVINVDAILEGAKPVEVGNEAAEEVVG